MADYSTLLSPEIWAFIRLTEEAYPADAATAPIEVQRGYCDALCAKFDQPHPKGIRVENFALDEEGRLPGLGLIKGRILRFSVESLGLRVPHMGWNQVCQMGDHPLWKNIEQDSRFYFVHSYYVQTDMRDMVSGITNYGADFVATLADGNIFATQFHPEKSHKFGMNLLANFAAI